MFPVGLMPEQVSERGSTFSQQTHKLHRTGPPKNTNCTVGKMRNCFLLPPLTTFFDIAKRECFRVDLNKHGHREPRKCVQCPLASIPILIKNNASNNNSIDTFFVGVRAYVSFCTRPTILSSRWLPRSFPLQLVLPRVLPTPSSSRESSLLWKGHDLRYAESDLSWW